MSSAIYSMIANLSCNMYTSSDTSDMILWDDILDMTNSSLHPQ